MFISNSKNQPPAKGIIGNRIILLLQFALVLSFLIMLGVGFNFGDQISIEKSQIKAFMAIMAITTILIAIEISSSLPSLKTRKFPIMLTSIVVVIVLWFTAHYLVGQDLISNIYINKLSSFVRIIPLPGIIVLAIIKYILKNRSR